MGSRVRELVDRVIEKVKALVTPPPALQPVPAGAPARPRR
jgi:hypothetical protein